ncbi:hypothetical protein [Nocardiopsis alba]|jgi:hypothetical protein
MDAHHALDNAARLLQAAEMEMDLAKMKAYGDLADSWLAMASLLIEQGAA